ncbi:RHS repeat-associated core domain-containing protein [Mesonia oceanica]|uniref:RHS repeat-associated core domain-containing protein n=1 Tax=Mesonia oceanica TaxID=2687242 RepID=UPI0012427E03|nr:RHS repeat-associated core domain-containing protein [Mesonia oceanica]
MFVEEHKNSNNSPYKFNAKELDEETGNYYYGARYYDPKWSVWLSVDPLVEQTMEAYTYVSNNPVRYTDPTGMSKNDWYKDKSGTVVYDESIKDQSDLDKAGIEGTYLHEDKFNKKVLDAIGADIMKSKDGYGTFLSYYENENLGSNYFIDAAKINYNSNAEGFMASITSNFNSVADGILVSMMTHDWVDTQGWTENRNSLEHNLGMFLIADKHGEKAALSIGWGNEWRGLLINDRQSGNMMNALTGRRANNGAGTAFEWSDISNNYKGLVKWRTYKGFYKADTNNDGKVSIEENSRLRLRMGGIDE